MVSKGYIIQDSQVKDFSPAFSYVDEVIPILTKPFDHYETSEVLSRFEEIITQFNPDNDFVILAGDTTNVFLTGVYLQQSFEEIRFLRWDGAAKTYEEFTIGGKVDYGTTNAGRAQEAESSSGQAQT